MLLVLTNGSHEPLGPSAFLTTNGVSCLYMFVVTIKFGGFFGTSEEVVMLLS